MISKPVTSNKISLTENGLEANEAEIQWYGGVWDSDNIKIFWDWKKDWESREEWREWRFVIHGHPTEKMIGKTMTKYKYRNFNNWKMALKKTLKGRGRRL